MSTPVYYNGLICLLGDSAHATTPHQASGAGQCIEDSLILSRLLGKVKDPKNISLRSGHMIPFDALERRESSAPARRLARFIPSRTSRPEEDMNKITANLNERFLWIWEHDLEGDIKKATEELDKLIARA